MRWDARRPTTGTISVPRCQPVSIDCVFVTIEA
jgi:hypothetical protein